MQKNYETISLNFEELYTCFINRALLLKSLLLSCLSSVDSPPSRQLGMHGYKSTNKNKSSNFFAQVRATFVLTRPFSY